LLRGCHWLYPYSSWYCWLNGCRIRPYSHGLCGKAKEIAAPTKETFDGIVIKAKPISSKRPHRTFSTKDATTTTSIRHTTGFAIASEVKPLEETKEDLVTNDDAMAVDEYPRFAEPSRRISTAGRVRILRK